MAKPPPNLLLCFDFDGTLINHEGEPHFHPGMGDMLRDFRKRGAAWVVNTGRSLSQTLEGLAQHHVFQLPDFIIARECEIYCPGFFKPWKDFGSWNKKARYAHEHFVTQHQAFLQEVRDHVLTHTKAEFLLGDLGNVGVVATDDAELDTICEFIALKSGGQRDIGYHRNGRYLRFSHTNYSKGTALRELARLIKVPTLRIFAAGDNYNDLSMLDRVVAGNIACPVNALEPVKEHVLSHGGFVASKPASEGMMQALDHFFKKRQGTT